MTLPKHFTDRAAERVVDYLDSADNIRHPDSVARVAKIIREEALAEEPLRLVTTRFHYREQLPPAWVAVGFANSPPRGPTKIWPSPNLTVLAPTNAERKLEGVREFTAAYVERLDGMGIDKVREYLWLVQRAHRAAGLAMCCYEDLTNEKKGMWCHRIVFARWWKARTGDAIADLEPIRSKARYARIPKPGEGTLLG